MNVAMLQNYHVFFCFSRISPASGLGVKFIIKLCSVLFFTVYRVYNIVLFLL